MTPCCAVLLPTRVFGGHERMLLAWLREAAAHGLSVRLYGAANERLADECKVAGFDAPVVSHPAPPGALRDFWATWRLLGRLPPSVPILFAPGVVQASPLQWIAAFLRRRAVAGYVPMAFPSERMRFRGGALRDWLVGHVVRRVDVWITISPEQRRLLIDRWRVKRPVFLVPNRLALASDGGPLPASGGMSEPRQRILFVGRFDANQKGLDWLCGALRAAGDWRARACFTFMGEGSYGPQLARLAAELGEAHIAVRPWGDTRAAMAAADVLLLPSRFEGVPLVALEAIHFGLPVVGTASAGVSRLVPGWCLFDFGNAAGMWRALHALRDPAHREAALAHSRRQAARLASLARFRREVGRVVGALARLAGSGQHARRAP